MDKTGAGGAVRSVQALYQGGTGRIAPSGEGVITRSSVLIGRVAMTAELEGIVNRGVSGEKALGLLG